MTAHHHVNLLKRLESTLVFSQERVRQLIEKHPDYFPMYTLKGRWKHEGEAWTNWCEGFLPGMMWIFYEQTGDGYWREKAEHYSRLIEHRKDDRNVHDLGFLFYHGTYRRWYETTVRENQPNKALNDVVYHAGRILAGRFMPAGSYLRSFVAPESLFVDIMMNVTVILYTAIGTGDRDLLDLSTRHCDTSRRYLIRGDGSSAHEAIFDLKTGECLRQSTHQGYRNDSCWSRGLAWALYGFATCARLAGIRRWLQTSQLCAEYIMEKLAVDPVPPWDFDAPVESRKQKDTSAGAIFASGLFELADAIQQLGGEENTQPRIYQDFALRILDQMCTPEYVSTEDLAWEGILKHGVYHKNKGLGVDESVMWGEFFFVEAVQRAIRYLSGQGR